MNLRDEIQNIKIVDHHFHGCDTQQWMDAIGSSPFIDHAVKLPPILPMTPMGRKNKMLTVFRELYDFPHAEVKPDNLQELDDLYQQSQKDEALFTMKALDCAGIESGVTMVAGKPVLPQGLDPKRLAVAAFIDGFIIPLENGGIAIAPRAKDFVRMFEIYPKELCARMNPTSFDDYLDLVSATLEDFVKQGVVALKLNYAYWRDIAIDVVSKEDAKDVYDKKDTSPARYKALQDYIMRHMIAKAAALDLPIQVHTGSFGIPQPIEKGNPCRFDPFLFLPDIMPAKVILLHGGYPFCREAGFMAGRAGHAPNLYLDISLIPFAVFSSPQGIVGILRKWLQAGLAPKMLYGSDAPTPFLIMMAAVCMREALYLALKGMVADGFIDEGQALTMARMILRENAKNLYKGRV